MNLRWLIILSAAGVMAVPAQASHGNPQGAAVTSFEGSCSFSGVFRFDPPLGNLPQATRFHDRAAGTCTGTLNGQFTSEAPIVIRAKGYGSLGCLAGEGTNFGTLTFTDATRRRGDDVSLRFSTEAAGGLTQFVARVRGAISGEGIARVDFLPYSDQAVRDACTAGTLETARYDVVVQTITPIVG